MRFTWVLLCATILFSCDFQSVHLGTLDHIEYGDTIKVVSYVTEMVYDTIYVTVEQPLDKNEYDTYIDTLKSYLGTRELTGNNDGEVVEMFLDSTCGLDNAAWCAAYLGWGLQATGNEIPKSSCWTPSYFPKDKIIWKRGDATLIPTGSIFGLYFKSKGRVAHVGAVVEDLNDGWVITIEGNTNSAGSREGDGVYIRLRHKSQLYTASDWIK